MKKVFEIISANSLTLTAPENLPALCFYQRPSKENILRLLGVGDIGLSGRSGETAKRKNYEILFKEMAAFLHTGDIVFGNLETSLMDSVPEGSLFTAPVSAASALADSGFTLLHLANNHILDNGLPGFLSTIGALRAAKITPLGAGELPLLARKLVRTDKQGFRIGWLGCGRTFQHQPGNEPYFWELNEEELVSAVRQSRPEVDVLIISMHMGFLYVDYPHPEHKALAQRLAALGADIILMHHAHVLQGIEVTENGSIICYNLGNFMFDWQEGNIKANIMVQEQNEGAVFLFDLNKRGVCLAAALPTYIDHDCRTKWATGALGLKILDRLSRISQALSQDYSSLFWRQRFERVMGTSFKLIGFHFRQGRWREFRSLLLESFRQAFSEVQIKHLFILFRWTVDQCRKVLRIG